MHPINCTHRWNNDARIRLDHESFITLTPSVTWSPYSFHWHAGAPLLGNNICCRASSQSYKHPHHKVSFRPESWNLRNIWLPLTKADEMWGNTSVADVNYQRTGSTTGCFSYVFFPFRLAQVDIVIRTMNLTVQQQLQHLFSNFFSGRSNIRQWGFYHLETKGFKFILSKITVLFDQLQQVQLQPSREHVSRLSSIQRGAKRKQERERAAGCFSSLPLWKHRGVRLKVALPQESIPFPSNALFALFHSS